MFLKATELLVVVKNCMNKVMFDWNFLCICFGVWLILFDLEMLVFMVYSLHDKDPVFLSLSTLVAKGCADDVRTSCKDL